MYNVSSGMYVVYIRLYVVTADSPANAGQLLCYKSVQRLYGEGMEEGNSLKNGTSLWQKENIYKNAGES